MRTKGLRNVFNSDSENLNKKLQSDYTESRKLAQQHEWYKHIELAKSMLPIVAYLEQDDFMARLLGRLAWSFIRLEEKKIASKLLQCSEQYDLWQAVANYFWSCEYSRRQMDMTSFANECLLSFRKLIKKIDEFKDIELPTDDLELAVMFYKKLIEHEEKSDVFADKSAKSDVARYFELKARLSQDPVGYEKAEEYYRNADLHPYATCCKAFRLMYQADGQSEIIEKKEKLRYASEALKNSEIFADDYIKDLLIRFVELREAFCDLYLIIEAGQAKADDILEKIDYIENIYKGENTNCFNRLSMKIPSFYDSKIYDEFSKMITGLIDGNIDCFDGNEIIKIDAVLNNVQSQLPSYTFTISKNIERR